MKRFLVATAIAAVVALPVAPAHAGALTDCINSEFWNQNLASCPGVFTRCVNTEFWNQNIPSCI